jgi:hypothetical protein
MSRALIVLDSEEARARAKYWIDKAPDGTRLEYKSSKRTLPQNAKLWAVLTEVAIQVPIIDNNGRARFLTAADWLLIFIDGLNRESDLVPNLDRTGYVDLRRRSSDMTVDEMAALIELIYHFGSQPEHYVKFRDQP